MKKSGWTTLIIIILIIAFAVYIKTKPNNSVDESIARCIGENAVVYSQIGCHFCEQQKDLFGDSYKYINEVLCNSDNWKTCTEKEITGTPTWIINNQKYLGLQSVEKLQELTGC